MTERMQALINALNLRLGYAQEITLTRDEFKQLIEEIEDSECEECNFFGG